MNHILILYTGGTIGMVKDRTTGSFVPFNFELIARNMPDLEQFDYRITVHSFDPIIDSSDMNEEIWIEMGKIIKDNYNQYDGFVILHGSDTMAFSASILSFMLDGLQKPVILSGSQLPIAAIRTDARENLLTALEIASAKRDGKSIIQEVCILFDNKLFRGNRAFKYNSAKFEAFRSPNYPLLAEAGIHIRYFGNVLLDNSNKDFVLRHELDNNVGVLKLFPGIPKKSVDAVLQSGVRGVVMETFGAGNAMTDQWFVDALACAIKNGVNIVDISQCKVGSVELGRYGTSEKLKKVGVLSGYDMTYEAAVTKLIYLQGQFEDQSEVAYWMESNIRGELTRIDFNHG